VGVGDSYDNALAETINGLYKAEVVHQGGPWRTFEAVEFAPLEWVDWFNNRRLLEPIGFMPTAEAEERYFAMLNDPAMAAWLKQYGLRQRRSGSGHWFGLAFWGVNWTPFVGPRGVGFKV
jgi:putative transposase